MSDETIADGFVSIHYEGLRNRDRAFFVRFFERYYYFFATFDEAIQSYPLYFEIYRMPEAFELPAGDGDWSYVRGAAETQLGNVLLVSLAIDVASVTTSVRILSAQSYLASQKAQRFGSHTDLLGTMTSKDGEELSEILYGHYWDFARAFFILFRERYYLFDSYFDDALDEYTPDFKVHRMPATFRLPAPGERWPEVPGPEAEYIGNIPTNAVRFDPTHRCFASTDALAKLLERVAS